MQHDLAEKLAKQLILHHGLVSWNFQYDRAKVRAGSCRHSKKMITLSPYFVGRNDEILVKDTILHEIAHALAGRGHGHDDYWKSICRRIGANPERCYDSEKVSMPEGRYKAVCGGCQTVFTRHRRVKLGRKLYCVKCGRVRGALQFN